MTVTADDSTASTVDEGTLGLVHLRVADADRAMAFFSSWLGWQGERVEFGDHVSHYTVNTDVTVRILDDPNAPSVVPNYRVSDVASVIRRIQAAGGTVTESEAGDDGGGWARGHDDQSIPLLVFRPRGNYAHAPATLAPSGDLGLVFIRSDADRARRFYGTVFGWQLEPGHPGSHYYEDVPRIGVFDEAAAFGTEVTPSVTCYLSVDTLTPAITRLEALGGHAGPVAQDMGPYYTCMCTDDQGTEFGLMALALE